MRVTFSYHESDDASASIEGMTFDEVRKFIQEHNEYFQTEYETIQEFNDGEAEANSIREIKIKINLDTSNNCRIFV